MRFVTRLPSPIPTDVPAAVAIAASHVQTWHSTIIEPSVMLTAAAHSAVNAAHLTRCVERTGLGVSGLLISFLVFLRSRVPGRRARRSAA